MPSSESFLTVTEFALLVRCSPITVRRWLRAGKLPGVRPGGPLSDWRIPTTAVADVLAHLGVNR